MKKLSPLLLVVGMAFLSIAAIAQDLPKFSNQPMLLEDGKLKDLEKQMSEVKMKAKGMGYGGTSSYMSILGRSSTVVTGITPEFVVKMKEVDVDPSTIFILAKCEVKSNRQIPYMRTSAFAGYGAGGKSVNKDHVQLKFEEYGTEPGAYKITTVGQLESGGEYGMYIATTGATAGSTTPIYCFRVK